MSIHSSHRSYSYRVRANLSRDLPATVSLPATVALSAIHRSPFFSTSHGAWLRLRPAHQDPSIRYYPNRWKVHCGRHKTGKINLGHATNYKIHHHWLLRLIPRAWIGLYVRSNKISDWFTPHSACSLLWLRVHFVQLQIITQIITIITAAKVNCCKWVSRNSKWIRGLAQPATTTGLSICLVSIRAPLTNSQRPVFHTYETLSLALWWT